MNGQRNVIEVPRDGREYVTFRFDGLTEDDTDLEAKFGEGPWTDLEVVTAGSEYRILVAGPDTTEDPAGTVKLAASSRVRVRVKSTPEIVVRPMGQVNLI